MFNTFHPSIPPQYMNENITSCHDTPECKCESASITTVLETSSRTTNSVIPKKPLLKFSIDYILGHSDNIDESSQQIKQEIIDNEFEVVNGDVESVDVNNSRPVVDHLYQGNLHNGYSNTNADSSDRHKYQWLQCTRYHPPKLQRTKKKEGTKMRKLDRNPRVPFTQHQLTVLEEKFGRTRYLSSMDVNDLSTTLNLTETRVKIWFQNRRARHRRENEAELVNRGAILHKTFEPLSIPTVTWSTLSVTSSQYVKYQNI